MPLEVRKKERESSQNLVRRFTKAVRQSGVLIELRGGRFHKRAKSALSQKKSALRREELKKERAKLQKMSKPEK